MRVATLNDKAGPNVLSCHANISVSKNIIWYALYRYPLDSNINYLYIWGQVAQPLKPSLVIVFHIRELSYSRSSLCFEGFSPRTPVSPPPLSKKINTLIRVTIRIGGFLKESQP